MGVCLFVFMDQITSKPSNPTNLYKQNKNRYIKDLFNFVKKLYIGPGSIFKRLANNFIPLCKSFFRNEFVQFLGGEVR